MEKIRISSGFTLVEMLVVCAIFFVATTAGAISFSQYNTGQTLEASSKNFASFLNDAKSKAVTQTIPEGCTNLQMYKVTITPPSVYEMWRTCGGIDSFVKSGKLPDGIVFDSGTSVLVTFVTGSGISNSGNIFLKGTFSSKTISVDNAGNITNN